MEEKKETVGAIASKLALQANTPVLAVDQMREQLTEYDNNVNICINEHLKVFPGDFYIVVLTKKERLMQNVLRNYFTARTTCPTPNYDQAVYKYHRDSGEVEFLWVVPSIEAVNYMSNNSIYIPKEQFDLLGYVLKFKDGSLMKLAKKLNGEKAHSAILE